MKLTNTDRKIVREWLDLYVKAPLYPLTEKSLARTTRWANGETQESIANDENVSQVAVHQSIYTLAQRIIEMAQGISK